MLGFEDLQPAAGLEGFVVWDRRVRVPEHHEAKRAFVSIRVGGFIFVNKAAYRMWGEPEACLVIVDPQRRRIGLKPVSPETENSYTLNFGPQIQIACKSLFDYYGVTICETRRYRDPKVLDGVLVVDL